VSGKGKKQVSNPWFRLYAEFISDPIIQCLSFEDQRHYVGILCLKGSGLLDKKLVEPTRNTIIIKSLGLDQKSSGEVKQRLIDMDLVTNDWEPKAWNKRQFITGETTKKDRNYIYFIGTEDKKSIKIGMSKNPWSRVRELQTGNNQKINVITTLATTEATTDREVHELFPTTKIHGEWFEWDSNISQVIERIINKEIKTTKELLSSKPVVDLRSNTTSVSVSVSVSLFNIFYNEYPKKKARKVAFASWQKVSSDLYQSIIDDVKNKTANDEEWKRGYAPYPATYLNQERWNDELTEVKPNDRQQSNKPKTGHDIMHERISRIKRDITKSTMEEN